MRRGRSERRHAERGAALVEYAVLVALVALVAIPAIDGLREAALAEYENNVPGKGRRTGADPPPPSPETSSPPTPTTAPATTTTAPPTSTTSPPTTAAPTTAPRVVASAAFTESSSWSTGWFRWAGSAGLTVTDAAGRPLAGAEVEVRVTAGSSARTVTVTTDASGRATVSVGPYDWYGFAGTGSVDVQVVGVTAADGTWDGTSPTRTIRAP